MSNKRATLSRTLTRNAITFLGAEKRGEKITVANDSSFFEMREDEAEDEIYSYDLDVLSEEEDLPLWLEDEFWDISVGSGDEEVYGVPYEVK